MIESRATRYGGVPAAMQSGYSVCALANEARMRLHASMGIGSWEPARRLGEHLKTNVTDVPPARRGERWLITARDVRGSDQWFERRRVIP